MLRGGGGTCKTNRDEQGPKIGGREGGVKNWKFRGNVLFECLLTKLTAVNIVFKTIPICPVNIFPLFK